MKPSLIVHPISYSPSGKTALGTAVALARVSGADLHVLELTGRRRSSQAPIVRPITDADVEPHFAEFVRSVYSADVKISAVELVGDIVDAVVDYARSASADLVVVADQARSHVPASRDERLAREGASSEEAKSHAEAIARIIGQSTVAKASSDGEGEALVRLGAIGEGTVKTAGEVGADLIVVTQPGAHHRVSMNSALARVLRNALRPVLVVPAPYADRIRVPLESAPAALESVLPR